MTVRKLLRNFKRPDADQEASIKEQRQWRIGEECAIYARQSTTKQTIENRESSEMQTKDQLERVHNIGWIDSQITVFIEGNGKRGVSGTLRIDERPGLSTLLEGIYNGKFKTLFVYNEGRLFRDEWQIQVNTFIKACYDKDVIITTNVYRYDFIRNPYDADQFRHQCEIAARFIKDHVKGVLHPARDRVGHRGQYAGGKLPIGYILDRRKYTDSNEFNTKYNHFIVDEPRAEVVRWIYRRYGELGGNLGQLGRELLTMGNVFPPYDDAIKGPKPKLPTGKRGLSRTGLISILTNTTYIGYFKYHDELLRDKDGHIIINHTSIIDEDDFWYAFNSLSPITIDGEINEQRSHKLIRYNQNGKQVSQALLKEIITSPNASVSTARMNKTHECYSIVQRSHDFEFRSQARTNILLLDTEFVKRMFYHINVWKQQEEENGNAVGSVIYERLQEERLNKQLTISTSLAGQLLETKTEAARYDRLLKVASDELDDETIKEYAKQLKKLHQIEKELTTKQEEVEKEVSALQDCETLLDEVLATWKDFNLEKKRRTIRLIVEAVIISRETARWLKVMITWRGPILPTTDIGYLWLRNGSNPDWQPDEEEILRKMYPSNDADVILEKFPNRTWKGIIAYAERVKVKRHVRSAPKKHPYHNISIEDNMFMESHNIKPREDKGESCMIWVDNEVFLPLESIDDLELESVGNLLDAYSDMTTNENGESHSLLVSIHLRM